MRSEVGVLQSKQVKQASLSAMPRNNLDYIRTSFERESTLQAAQHIYESKDGHCYSVSVISDNAFSNLPEDMDDKRFLHLNSHVEESTLTDFTPVYSRSTIKTLHTDMVGRDSNFPIEGQVTLTSTENIQEFRHSTSVVGSKSAPISSYACRTGDGIDKIQEIHLEASANKNLHTFAIPTPVGGRSTSVTGGMNNSAIDMKLSSSLGAVNSRWHTSPLEQCNTSAKSDTNLCPLIGKSRSRKSVVCSSGPLPSLQVESSSKSGPISRYPKSCTYVFPKPSPSISPHHLSPPCISELHELPRPLDKGQEHIIELEPGTKPVIIPPYRYILGAVETFLDAVPLVSLMSRLNGKANWNISLQNAIEECLMELAKRICDAGPVFDLMAMTLEKLSIMAVPARVTIGAMLILAHIIASISYQSYVQQGFPEALFHQLLQAMSDSWYDTKKTLSKPTSAFVSAAALFEKLRSEKVGSQEEIMGSKASDELKDRDAIEEEWTQDAIRKSPTRFYSMNRSIPHMRTISSSPKDTEMNEMRLSADQVARFLSALWIQANLPDKMPANFEVIAHTFSLTLLFSQIRNSNHSIPVRSRLVFAAKAFNFLEIVELSKAPLTAYIVDPYLKLADDLRLNVKVHTDLKEYGSVSDERVSDLEGSAISKELCETFSPDDGFAFGLQLLLESGHGWKPGFPKESLSFDKVLPASSSMDGDLNSKASGTDLLRFLDKTSVTAALPHITSVGQLLESALEAAGQVASAAVSTSPLPFSAMASQCEAFGASTRK
eukprot:Gb_02906 [translate_table: standard]